MSERGSADGGTHPTRRGANSGLRTRLGWWWQAPLGLLIFSVIIVLISTIAFGATRPNTGNPPAPGGKESTPRLTVLHSPFASPPDLAPAPELPELSQAIASIERRYDVTIGITLDGLAVPYQRTQQTWYGGTLRSGDAFATIDVAIALAVLDNPRQPQDRGYLFNRSLAGNSAAADDAMWAFLGTADEAATKTTNALRDHGDWTTRVPAESDRDIAPYLTTDWRLDAQSRLMAALYCDAIDMHPVLSQLNDRTPDPWGLQTLPLSYAKGGWGELANGETMVRQFGLIRLRGGQLLGISMAAVGGDDPDAGKQALTELAGQVRQISPGTFASGC